MPMEYFKLYKKKLPGKQNQFEIMPLMNWSGWNISSVDTLLASIIAPYHKENNIFCLGVGSEHF